MLAGCVPRQTPDHVRAVRLHASGCTSVPTLNDHIAMAVDRVGFGWTMPARTERARTGACTQITRLSPRVARAKRRVVRSATAVAWTCALASPAAPANTSYDATGLTSLKASKY